MVKSNRKQNAMRNNSHAIIVQYAGSLYLFNKGDAMKPFRILTISTLLLISVLPACGTAANADISEPEPGASPPEPANTPPPATPRISKLEPEASQPEPANTFPPVTPRISKLEQTPVNNSAAVRNELVEKARQDLAQRLGISLDSITVGAVIGQEFSVNAFYCRETKERIAKEESPQVVLGWSILLNASGRRYEYHASDQMVIFCRPLS
jgi:hypothetical protein